ncbi:MAG: hypothetical protein J6B77_05055 [Clostridia bacterium]|nr:hypothetical protein [Clostridia bacterium]
MKRIWSVALALLLLCSCVGCDRTQVGDVPEGEESVQGSDTQAESVTEETVRTETVYRVLYEDVRFLSAQARESLRAPLTYLLSNRKVVIAEGGDILGYTSLYPDRPCIENGYQLGLFDINVDGVPELLVNLGGGSAGNAFYYVYDVQTGEQLGSLHGGHDRSWCVYFCTETGRYESIGQFEWRIGWMGKERYVHRADIGERMSGDGELLYESEWLYAYYEIDAVNVDLTKEEIDAGISSAWDEAYTGVSFRVDGSHAYIDDYFDACDTFAQSYIRIPETALRLIDWDDVCDLKEDQSVRAEKMAEALLSSGQEFIVPKE